jgi:hypothetical protein
VFAQVLEHDLLFVAREKGRYKTVVGFASAFSGRPPVAKTLVKKLIAVRLAAPEPRSR